MITRPPQPSIPTYEIACWTQTFETADSRKHKRLHWVSWPIDRQSSGYQSMVDEFGDDAPSIYGAWAALVTIAAELPIRGRLANSRGEPLSTTRLARMAYMPDGVFQRLFEWASNPAVGWLVQIDDGRPAIDQQLVGDQSAIELQDITLQDTTLPNSCDEVFTAWNESPGVTKRARKLTTQRRQKLLLRLKDPDWPWREAIAKLPVANTPKFTWQPTFDWLINNDENALKIVEGNYQPSPIGAGQTHDPGTKVGGGF